MLLRAFLMPVEPDFIRVGVSPTLTGIIRAAEMQLSKFILRSFSS